MKFKISRKLNAKNKFSFGIQADYLDLLFDEEKLFSDENETNHEGNTMMFQGHGQWLYKLSDDISSNAGIYVNHFQLNNSTTLKPRFSVKWNINTKHSVNAGYGLHSQNFPSYAFFIEETDAAGTTFYKYGDVKPMMSHHFIIGYDYFITENLRFKLDMYYQSLFNIPVEKTPLYWSGVNLGGDFAGFPDDLDVLENKGTGKNYGIELTLERFFDDGYFFLSTVSVYESKYKGSNGIERNTAFNGQYVMNLLAGKEFKVGKNKENTLAINIKSTLMGGKRYIPIDRDLTQLCGLQNQFISTILLKYWQAL